MITKEDVEHVGWLARIEIDENDASEYASQLSEVLNHFEQLDEVNTENVSPTYHVIDLVNVFREDVARETLTKDEALANTSSSKEGYFKSYRII